jgi:hypothetical protein
VLLFGQPGCELWVEVMRPPRTLKKMLTGKKLSLRREKERLVTKQV